MRAIHFLLGLLLFLGIAAAGLVYRDFSAKE